MTTGSLRVSGAKRTIRFVATVVLLAACTRTSDTPTASDTGMNAIGESYVKTVLALGVHDKDYVDAFYGDSAWKKAADSAKAPLDQIRRDADTLLAKLGAIKTDALEEIERLRHTYLTRQLQSLVARTEMLQGKKLSFDEESQALYDAVAPHHDSTYFKAIIDSLGGMLPGQGPVQPRYEQFRKSFIIPPAKLDSVFTAAIEACKARTSAHFPLPPGETFRVEYVTGKSWSGYNWYQGGFNSLIQVNTSLPIYIDRALDLACHEGYPGHHVYNALLEQSLVRGRGWVEFSVYPLFSPQSLIAEGSANYGIELAFPGAERAAYERDSLFARAGIDPSRAEEYYRVQGLVKRLSYAGNEAARGYLDGKMTAAQAVDWLTAYALNTKPQAEQRIKFFDQYRSYVINYNLGQDLVKDYVERAEPAKRWSTFQALLSSPRLPSGLR